MGERYLIDTNVLIYYISNAIPKNSIDKIETIFIESLNISIISKIEFLGWKYHTAEKFDECRKLISYAKIFYINENIAEAAIELRRNSVKKVADAIIAATALSKNLTLVTRNVDDFAKTKVKIYNPFEK